MVVLLNEVVCSNDNLSAAKNSVVRKCDSDILFEQKKMCFVCCLVSCCVSAPRLQRGCLYAMLQRQYHCVHLISLGFSMLSISISED